MCGTKPAANVLTLIMMLLCSYNSWAQPCSGAPSFTINLSGSPDSIWTSPSISRSGDCCGSSNPDRCIEFNLTLDSMSSGIKLDIPSGALPGGALFYQIGCGTSYQVGQEICLSGPGPHRITFCKPGNNTNVYQIKAIPKPDIRGKLLITQACIGFLKVSGLVDTSITWESVPNNPVHNSYLSCLQDCDSVSIIPTGNYPSSVIYRVCGLIQGGCGGITFCDTATVHFVTDIDVDIQPKNPTVCFGGTNTTLTATPVGGLAPFYYTWSTGSTASSISVGAGTYHVSMTDSLGCFIVRDTVTVTSFSLPIKANAGNDTTLCSKANYALLNGTIQSAGGGKWIGGTGMFTPNDSALTAIYYPSASETNAGTVILKLTTTNNGSCPADSDFVQLFIRPTPSPVIVGPSNACEYKISSYTTNTTSGNSYQWNVTGGIIQGSNTDTFVTIKWNATGGGFLTLRQSNSFNCDSVITKNIFIQPSPSPIITGPLNVCEYKTSTYTTNPTTGNSYQWSVTGGVIQGINTDTFVTVKWNNTGVGIVTLKQTNSFNCDSAISKNIAIQPTPSPIITGPSNVCEFKTSTYTTNTTTGNSYQWNVTGGIIQGMNTDTIVTIKWNGTGIGIVSIQHTNISGCDSTVSKSITIQPTPTPVINGPASACGYKTSTYTTVAILGSSYEWNVTGGIIQGNNTDTFIVVNWNNAGVGIVSLKRTNSLGCDSAISKNVSIRSTPTFIITGPVNVCEFKTSTYTTNRAIGHTCQWSVTGGMIQGIDADTFVTVKWNGTGIGAVTLKQTNSFNCDSSVSKNVIIQPSPAPIITGLLNVCEFKTSTYTTNTTIGNTYQWNVTGGTIQGITTDTFITVKWNGTGAGIVMLKQTNSSNCDSIVSKSIIIQPTPVPMITGPAIVCEHKTSTYTIPTITGNTYQWIVTGGIIQGITTDTFITVKWNGIGAGMVMLKQTNGSNCDSTVTKSIIIQSTPVPMITGTGTVCEHKTSTYTAPATTGITYQWNVTGGVIQGSTTDTFITVKWNGTGAGIVVLKQTNSSNCDSTVTKSIIIQSTPVPMVTGPGTVCEHKTSTYTAPATTGITYQWNVTGGIIQGSTTDTFITVKWNGTGAGIVVLKQKNSSNCDSTVSKNIIIQPAPNPLISGPVNVCENKISIYSTIAGPGDLYQWNVTGGTIQGTDNDTFVTVKWNGTGTGIVSLKQSNSFNCDSIVTKTITIQPVPAPVITGPSSSCEYQKNTYTCSSVAGHSYEWSVTGGTIQEINSDTFINVKWNASGTGNITLKQTGIIGCDSIISRSVNIRPTPIPDLSGPLSVCAFKRYTYTTSATFGNSYQWAITGGVIEGNSTDTFVSVVWSIAGIGSLSIKHINSSGCDSMISRSVTILPLPVPVIAGPSSVCAYQQSTYSVTYVTGSSFHWSVSGGNIISGVNDSVVKVKWNASGNAVLTLTQINNLGCDSVISKIIVINTLPVPVISGNDTGCMYKNSIFSTSLAAGNICKWNISGSARHSADTLLDIYVIWNDSLNAGISLTVTNSFGCDSTQIKGILVKESPSPKIYGDTIVCKYGSHVYRTNKLSGTILRWTVPGGIVTDSSADTAIRVIWGLGNTEAVTLTATNSNGCDSSISLNISLFDRTNPQIVGPDTVCERKSNTYMVSEIIGNSYLWTASGGTIQGSRTTSSVKVIWANTGMKQLMLYERGKADCDTTVTVNVFVKPTPAPVITGPNIACAYRRAVYYTNKVASDHYAWSVTGGVIEATIADTQIHVLWSNASSATVGLRQTNQEGCDSIVSLPVMIKSAPVPQIIGPSVVCEYRKVVYATQSGAGNTYQWIVSGGEMILLNDTLIEVRWNGAGTGFVSLKVISPSLCDSLVTNTIQIMPIPDPQFSGPLTVCAYTTEVYSIVPQPGASYKWAVSGGTIQGSSILASVTVVWGGDGTGQFSLQIQSASGCDSSVTKEIKIRARPDTKIKGSKISCAGPEIYTYSSVLTGEYLFDWSVIGGTITTGNGTETIAVNWPQKGDFNVALHLTDTLTLCDTILSLPVLVDSVVKPLIKGSAMAGCIPLKITFSGNQASPGYSYRWDFGNGNFSDNVNPEYVYTQPGVFTIKVEVKSSNGCSDTVSASVAASLVPVADFSYEYQNERIYAGEDTVKFINKSKGGNSFIWQITSERIDTGDNPRNIYNDPGFYNVKLITIDTLSGCEQSTVKKLEVRVRERLYAPNVFTPDGDGINDFFHVSVINIIEFEVIIFDRWGSILYQSNDPLFKWDGNYRNQPVQSDVYGFVISGKGYHGTEFSERGTVTVLR